MNPFWNWLKDPGTQAMLVLIAIVLAALSMMAAAIAAYFGWKSPSRGDLKRVEDNTAHLEEVRAAITSLESRSKRQEEAVGLADRATSVSITVKGQGDMGKPLPVYLTGTEPDIYFSRVEFRNNQGSPFGHAVCMPTDNLFEFVARIPSTRVKNWFNGSRGGHILRVWMRFDGHPHEVHKDMAVTLDVELRGSTKDDPPGNVSTFTINGAV